MAKPTSMPTVPQVPHAGLQQYLQDMHEIVSGLVTSAQVPNAPTGLTVTPIAGGNVIQFTRSNAVSYSLFISPTADRSQASQVNLGTSNRYTDNVGEGGATRFYWVQGLNQQGAPSATSQVASGATLALTAPTAVIPVAVQSFAKVYDTTLGRERPVISTTDPEVAGLPTSPRS